MKKTLLILCAIMALGSASAQDTTQTFKHSSTQTFKLYGFVRNYFNFAVSTI